MRLLALLATAAFAQTPEQITFFEKNVRPVLAARCYSCHSAQAKTPFAGLKVDSREGLLKGGDHGPAIVPGQPDASRLMRAIRYQTIQMPPDGKLSAEQIEAFARWVEMGAQWPVEKAVTTSAKAHPAANHWAWQPVKHDFPAGVTLDSFIRAKLRASGLQTSPIAGKRTLMRRLSYDITGLPPSAEELEAFEADTRPDAYDRLVERLLASPAFGERWARYWLDLARFSDVGFSSVRFPYAFSYRDWVIQAINDDMPYADFVRRQLAADQIPNDDKRHLAALGFLSLGQNNPRNTAIPDKVDDRIDTVTRTFLGLTVACARCHDHKYDPIPTRDYYSLYGVFLNSEEPWDHPLAAKQEGATPLDRFYLARLEARRQNITRYKEQRIEEIRAEAREPEQVKKYLLLAWQAQEMTNPQVDNLSREKNVNLLILRRWRDFLKTDAAAEFRREASQSTEQAAARYADKLIASGFLMKPEAPPTIPFEAFINVLTEGDYNTVNNLRWKYDAIFADYGYRGSPARAMSVVDKQQLEPAHVLVRGNMNDLGDEVPRQFLSVIAGVNRQPFAHGSGRLDLAAAINEKSNPLTARVFVNRTWQRLFGEGIVRSPSDFGTRGEEPTHPELLDYLATTFQKEGGSLKQLIRRIVRSDTYRQSSSDNAAARAKDPENRLLWRQNRRRLDFEALRDTMLAAAGHLDRTVGGPSFMLATVPSAPRRTMYAYQERERAQALLKSFNFADPEQHTPQRFQTTVPQQALFLMNSDFLMEQARRVAERASDVRALYRMVLMRDPSPDEERLARPFHSKSARSETGDRKPWQYGWGELDPAKGRVTAFHPFRYFFNETWQAGPILPSPEGGRTFLTSGGGAPGDDLKQAVIRRWVAPADGTVDIAGVLSQSFDIYEQRFGLSNGVRAWIVSSRGGVLGSWTIDPPGPKKQYESADVKKIGTNLSAVEVRTGDTIDFVVDSRDDYEGDEFKWAPTISAAGRKWDAAKEFAGPSMPPLTAWEQLAQVLLLTNELAFVD